LNDVLTIAQAAQFYPPKTHSTTIIRHITRGIKTPNGVVKLEATRLGGRWVTTRAAIDRFSERLTAKCGAVAPEPTQTRKAASEKSKAFLRAIGALR
jgi:hypothetical protein